MNNPKKEDIITLLSEHVTPERRERMQAVLHERTRYVTVVLEDIFQPHNASAIVRSTECFGVQDLHVIEKRNRFKATEGVALGGDDWLTMHRYTTTQLCLEQLKKEGYRIVATTLDSKAYSLPDLPLDSKVALMFGTELTGLSPYVLENADAFVTIPMYGFTQSFNVSVSVALCLYQLTQKLRSSDYPWRLSADEQQELYLAWLRKSVRAASMLERRFLGS